MNTCSGAQLATALVNLIGNKVSLPDFFSEELMVSSKKYPDENLQVLARRHQELSKKYINGPGTYKHGAERFIIHLEKPKAWQTSKADKS